MLTWPEVLGHFKYDCYVIGLVFFGQRPTTLNELKEKLVDVHEMINRDHKDMIRRAFGDFPVRIFTSLILKTNALVKQNIFGKTCVEVCSSHLYASYGTFYGQIGQ